VAWYALVAAAAPRYLRGVTAEGLITGGKGVALLHLDGG
jgi:hypothetical protein